MCYTSGQTGIIQRMLREEGGWQGHLSNTSQYILSGVEKYNPRTIRILGSGWLLDVPMKELIEKCDRITLVDIIHPRQVVSKYSKYEKILFETVDLSGGVADLLFHHSKKQFSFDRFLPKVKQIEPFHYSDDMVASVNVMSQLSIFLTDYLLERFKVNNDQLIEFAAIIQQKHLESLPKGKTILSTDYEEEFLSEEGKVIGTNPTIFVPLPRNSSSKEWDWLFDYKMTYKLDRQTKLKIAAVMI